MKMVRAGPSTYYSDAIVKHFSPVSSGFVTWIFHRIRGTMWFFSISICKMFLIHLLPGFSLWVSASFWDGMLLKWWFLAFTSILCYLKKWAELQMPINRVCDNLYRSPGWKKFALDFEPLPLSYLSWFQVIFFILPGSLSKTCYQTSPLLSRYFVDTNELVERKRLMKIEGKNTCGIL